jgi:hypothetical protein
MQEKIIVKGQPFKTMNHLVNLRKFMSKNCDFGS